MKVGVIDTDLIQDKGKFAGNSSDCTSMPFCFNQALTPLFQRWWCRRSYNQGMHLNKQGRSTIKINGFRYPVHAVHFPGLVASGRQTKMRSDCSWTTEPHWIIYSRFISECCDCTNTRYCHQKHTDWILSSNHLGLVKPWISFSRSTHFLKTAFLVLRSALNRWLSKLFTWTRLYHLVRTICAIPHASFLSVLLHMADSATLACRASKRMTSNPAACRLYVRYCVRRTCFKTNWANICIKRVYTVDNVVDLCWGLTFKTKCAVFVDNTDGNRTHWNIECRIEVYVNLPLIIHESLTHLIKPDYTCLGSEAETIN